MPKINLRIRDKIIFEDIPIVLSILDRFFDDIVSSDWEPTYSLFSILVDFNHLAYIYHQVIDVNIDHYLLTFDVERIAILSQGDQFIVFRSLYLEIIKEVFLCPRVLLEENAVRIRVSSFLKKIEEYATIFQIHPVRA